MRRIGMAVGLATMVALTGCSSLGLRVMWWSDDDRTVWQVGHETIPIPPAPPMFYAGTLFDAACLTTGEFLAFACLVDLPFSAALDTLLLPYDAFEHVRYRVRLEAARERAQEARRRLLPISVWAPEPTPSGAAGATDVLAGLGVDRDYVTLVDEVRHPDD